MNKRLILDRYNMDLSLILALIIFVLAGIILLPYYQYQINGDGIAYISIAKMYFSHDIINAIDAYHSPLISWLIVPFLFLGLNPAYLLLSTKIISLIVGLFAIIGIRQLSYKFEMNKTIRTGILFLLIPVILYFAFSVITPDLLLLCILIYYFNLMFSDLYFKKSYYAFLCGLLGSLAYFAKSYAFPFFLIHFIFFNFLYYFNNRDKNILKKLLLGLLVFFVLSSTWIGLISQKSGEITYSTASEFNHNLVGPESNGWTTPYLGETAAEVKPWSSLSSWNNFKYQLKLILYNTIQTINILESFSYFAIILLLAYLLMFIKPVRETLNDKIFYFLLTFIIFAAGYLFVLVEERYLWLLYILLILMGGYLLNNLFKIEFFTKKRQYLLLIIFLLSFVILPVSFLYENVNSDKDIYILSKEIEKYNISGNIASNDYSQKTFYLSYYQNSNYSGQTKKEDIQRLESDLIKYNISFYFVWETDNNSPLLPYTDITGGNIKGLKIYRDNYIINQV